MFSQNVIQNYFLLSVARKHVFSDRCVQTKACFLVSNVEKSYTTLGHKKNAPNHSLSCTYDLRLFFMFLVMGRNILYLELEFSIK